MTAPRVLLSGVGNLFLGDDGFGPEVVRRFVSEPAPPGVTVMDAGVRSFDLRMALSDPYDAAILVDVATRGRPPGTLYVLEPELPGGPVPEGALTDGHSVNLNHVLADLAASGSGVRLLRVVACEPLTFGSEFEPALGLSDPVARAVEPAIELVRTLLAGFGVDVTRQGAPRTPAIARGGAVDA